MLFVNFFKHLNNLTLQTESTYTVSGKTVNILRETAITPDLQGLFSLNLARSRSNLHLHLGL